MKDFRWVFNWLISDIYTNRDAIIPVRHNGRLIGECKISIEEDKVVGSFTLSEELNKFLYVLYTVSVSNQANQRFLEGIFFTEFYDGIENRARQAKDMELL
jgi:hypothetical protein